MQLMSNYNPVLEVDLTHLKYISFDWVVSEYCIGWICIFYISSKSCMWQVYIILQLCCADLVSGGLWITHWSYCGCVWGLLIEGMWSFRASVWGSLVWGHLHQPSLSSLLAKTSSINPWPLCCSLPPDLHAVYLHCTSDGKVSNKDSLLQ